jgi:hypothetical protein
MSFNRMAFYRNRYAAYSGFEVGREGHFGTVTFWHPELLLRLRIRHYTYEFEDEFTCEVKLREADEYVVLKRFRFQTEGASNECDWDTTRSQFHTFPDAFRTGFVMLVRHWAAVLAVTELAPSPVKWVGSDLVYVDREELATVDEQGDAEPAMAKPRAEAPLTCTSWPATAPSNTCTKSS